MLSGISLALSNVPPELIAENNLENRIRERGGEREVEFLFRDSPRLLPVWSDGHLQLVTCGNGRGESWVLPTTGWTQRETVESGGWSVFETKQVLIPATLGVVSDSAVDGAGRVRRVARLRRL